MDDAAFYTRLRAVCCSAWGCAPARFEDMVSRGEVALEDVLEAVVLRGASPLAGDVLAYLFREVASKKRSKFEQISGLVMQMRATTDDATRAKLAAMIDELNRR